MSTEFWIYKFIQTNMKLRFNIKKIKTFFEKLLFLMAENIFSSCLVLILLTLVIGTAIFYKAVFPLNSANFESSELLRLEKEKYNNILKIWEEEDKKMSGADSKKYKDVFAVPSFSPEIEEE